MSDSVEKIMKPPRQYWFEDGLIEIGMGLSFTVIGGLVLTQSMLRRNNPLFIILSLVLMALIFLSAFLLKRFFLTMKERIVYPRTGYVAYKEKRGKSRWLIVIVALILAGASLLGIAWLNQTSVMTSILFAVMLGLMAHEMSLVRLYGLAGYSLALGILFIVTQIADPRGVGLYFTLMGVGLLLGGSIMLARYLKNNPPVNADSHD